MPANRSIGRALATVVSPLYHLGEVRRPHQPLEVGFAGQHPLYSKHLSGHRPYALDTDMVNTWSLDFQARPRVLALPLRSGSGQYRVVEPLDAVQLHSLAETCVVEPDKPGQATRRVLTPLDVARFRPDRILVQHSISDQDIANLQSFGEAALEQMQRMGIGYRELRQYRRLPEDQKSALIEAAKVGDKDSFLELAEDLIAKHAKEKQALAQKNSELEKDAQATGRVLADKQSEITKLQTQVATKKYLPHVDWPEAMKGYIEQAQKAKRDILLGIDALAVIRQESLQIESQSKDEDEVLGRAWIALAAEMQDIFAIAGGKLEAEARTFDNTLQAVADDHREGSK